MAVATADNKYKILSQGEAKVVLKQLIDSGKSTYNNNFVTLPDVRGRHYYNMGYELPNKLLI